MHLISPMDYVITFFLYLQVWLTVSGAEALREEWGSDFYQKLLSGPVNQDIVDIVKTDLPRTFPDNIFFSAEENHQQQLYNILVAYAHDNHQVGYCQVCVMKRTYFMVSTKQQADKVYNCS